MSNSLPSRVGSMRPLCNITVDSTCKVKNLLNTTGVTFNEHWAFHNHEAVVIKLNENSVDIKMKTGSHKGCIIEKVSPIFLLFEEK